MFNEVNSREIEKINVFTGMFDSWVFTGVMVVTVVFQVIIVEFLGAFASTVPLSWQHWLLSILIGSLSMIVAVILKCIPVESSHQHHDGYDLLPSGPSSSNSAWYHFNVFCLLSGPWFQICKILQILVFFYHGSSFVCLPILKSYLWFSLCVLIVALLRQ